MTRKKDKAPAKDQPQVRMLADDENDTIMNRINATANKLHLALREGRSEDARDLQARLDSLWQTRRQQRAAGQHLSDSDGWSRRS
jgi:hypothetical protein